jgi:CDP-diacylglycerol---serine O-phosphatidyltransferase
MAEITSLRQGGWRYLLPNGLTALNLGFGAIACFLAISGSYYSAGWFILLAVCFDRLDGASARALGATSQFGVEFDSLADLVSFGIAPAVLVFAVLSNNSALGYGSGWRQYALMASCSFYVICCAFRLARFNVFAGADGTKIYFGLPSPASASTVVASLMTLIKYGGGGGGWVADAQILGGLTLPASLLTWFPLVVAAVGLLMVSTLRVPKMTPDKSIKGIYLSLNMLLIYVCVLLRIFPEYLAFMAVQVIVVSFSFHFFWESARHLNAGTVWQALSIEADATDVAESAPEAGASK